MKAQRGMGVEISLYSFFNFAARWERVVDATPRPHYPQERPSTFVQVAGWAPESVWTGAKNLSPTGIPSPERPARSESLYRLSYLDPIPLY